MKFIIISYSKLNKKKIITFSIFLNETTFNNIGPILDFKITRYLLAWFLAKKLKKKSTDHRNVIVAYIIIRSNTLTFTKYKIFTNCCVVLCRNSIVEKFGHHNTMRHSVPPTVPVPK